jgi:2-polyprenyl-6-methoxyphenol hydroxylase-like FAD-dependent oxidoreductase
MLLAQLGHRVLLVDRASFPSDTMSTHLVTLPGVARLDRWGLLERVAASGCPPISEMTVRLGHVVLRGSPPSVDRAAHQYCVRRTVLDTILVGAAVEAGAELREGFAVREVLFDGDRVSGVRGRGPGGAEVVERARLVVGADGLHSLVAEAVEARRYAERPALTWCCYAYWSGMALDGAELHVQDRRAVSAFPTNDGLACLSVAWPASEAAAFRADVEGNFLATLRLAPGLTEAVAAGERVRPFVGTADLPNFLREPHGPGWALVGDAGCHKDPLLARGISDAFRDAEILAEAADAGLSGNQLLEEALAGYEQRRNQAVLPAYDLTARLAALESSEELAHVLEHARRSPEATDRFLGVFAGSVPVEEFFPAVLTAMPR